VIVGKWGCGLDWSTAESIAYSSRIMTALRQILSDTLAVLLRLSACITTSSHPETFEEPYHPPPHPHLPDQQPSASHHETSSTSTMSLRSHIVKPSSYLQSLFDLTLIEYSKQTGIDLITHPFVASLDDVSSADMAIAVLRERIPSSSDSKSNGRMALLDHLESIARIVSLLSPNEALCDNIDPVCRTLILVHTHLIYAP
jgi:hypothetical protein